MGLVPQDGPEGFAERGFLTTQVDSLVNWARTGSLWPMTFGLLAMLVFALVLVVALIYDYRKGALEWD